MTWTEWIDSSYNDGYVYIDTFNEYEYVFYDEYCEPIGCSQCTQRQRVEYEGEENQAGLCWDCQEYVTFYEYAEDVTPGIVRFSVCGEEYIAYTWYSSWEEWINSELNTDGLSIDSNGNVCSSDGYPIGCVNCTRRQRAEYDGIPNCPGYCWNCLEYTEFEEFPY